MPAYSDARNPLPARPMQEFEAVEGSDRTCTDIAFVFIFLLVIAILSYLGIQNGLNGGNPNFILKGWDSFGNICGEKNAKNLTAHPNSGLDMTFNTHWYVALRVGDGQAQVHVQVQAQVQVHVQHGAR